MASYIDSMEKWKADEKEPNEKRLSLSARLDQIRQQAHEDLAKARQAGADAQKAAKNLATATEHHRRQQLIVTALEQEQEQEQEQVMVSEHITEARQEHKKIAQDAIRLAHMVLEEQWNAAADALFDVGGELWASYNLLGHDQVGLMKRVVPEEGENFSSWKWHELSERARQHTVQDILAI